MDSNEREIFNNIHGMSNKLERIKSEIETRKLSHKDFLQNLKLDSEVDNARKLFNVLNNHKSNANSILDKYKKYMNL